MLKDGTAGFEAYDSKSQRVPITRVEYSGLQAAYDHFNAELFDGALGDLMITYQRRAHSEGYFAAERFSGRDAVLGKQHELALNPDAFSGQTDEEIISTLVHEMAHAWQFAFGKRPANRGYHNREWAGKMKAIGLHPSDTGQVGGKETGTHMSHYIVAGGPFAIAFAKLAATGWHLNLESRQLAAGTRPNSKVKFSCSCGQNAWGKHDLAIGCLRCGEQMRPEDN
jgi:predicted SprT family Zn-dependent metalloprotease